MLLRDRVLLFLVGSVTIASSFSRADSSGEATAFAQLPKHTMLALHVARLDDLDNLALPLVDKLGWNLPAFGQLASDVEGVDTTGELVVGIAQTDKNRLVPFLLLPVSDYKAFVHAADGDAGIEVTQLTLAGEELMGTQRADWTLVTNPLEDFASLGRLDTEVSAELEGLVGDVLISVIATRNGLDQLQKVAESRSESIYQKANRRRMLSSRPISWLNLDHWLDRVTIYSRAVDRLNRSCRLVMLSINVTGDRSVSLRLVAPLSAEEEIPRPSWNRSPLKLDSERMIAAGDGPWGSPWTTMLVELYLDNFEVSSNEWGINYLRDNEFKSFRTSIAKVDQQVKGWQALMIAPGDEKPVMSNSALLLDTPEAAKLTSAIQEAVDNWNRLVESSTRRDIDFFFGVETLQLGNREGKRYTVDLADAFRSNDVPDVRDVMNKMYGRNGMWVIDVLPVDDTSVLVSDLPDDSRNQLLAAIETGQPTSVRESRSTTTIRPAVLQNWLNDVKRLSFGDNVIGWKPKQLNTTSDVLIHTNAHSERLTIEVELSHEAVNAVGQFFQGKAGD